MLSILIVSLCLCVALSIAPQPFKTKAEALDRKNHEAGRPQTITMEKGDESVLVSWDEETIDEYKAKGFNPIPIAKQNAIDTARIRAEKGAPALKASEQLQADKDAADTKLMLADLLAAWRKDKAKADPKAAKSDVPKDLA